MTEPPVSGSAGAAGWVEVAVDAAGVAGGKLLTYHVPAALGAVVPGEVVIVPYGGRRAVGVVLGLRSRQPDRETRPIGERVRAAEPILPPLQVALARHIAQHYLAPPALVVRSMLPPGLLDRVELVARAPRGAAVPDAGIGDAAAPAMRILAEWAGEEVPVADLPAPAGRPRLLTALRRAAEGGAVELAWRLLPPGARPREVRVVELTPGGREAAEALRADAGTPGAALGPRQRAVLETLLAAADGTEPLTSAELAAGHGASAVASLRRRGLVDVRSVVRRRDPLAGRPVVDLASLPPGSGMSGPQGDALARVLPAVRAREVVTFLIQGVTASGKTAVYAAAVREALSLGRGALVLVPEIALATPLVDRLRADLPVPVAVLHGALGEGERADEWRRVRDGEARIVVGTRTAILAPLADPGIIVVDEEHDPAYKADRTPRYQARDVARVLGALAGAPVILGSATPEVASWARARGGELEHLLLPERVTGERPEVEVVDLRDELAAGNRGLLSSSLARALRDLDVLHGERAILVLNRRGSASVVLCRDCGYVQVCPECQRPLVFHATTIVLRCHHCGATAPVARRCPACGSPRIRYLGGGTERLERELREHFPGLRIGRLDRDVAERKGAAARVLDAFADGALDVLVGTSLVTKGIDVPEVTLVGIVSADVALNLPDERAAERTYQFLAQAIGRAGRGTRPGRALIQSYQPEHPAIVAAASGVDDPFYTAELALRRAFLAPPFARVVKLVASDEDRERAQAEAERMVERLRARAPERPGEWRILGPAPAYIARGGGRWRFTVAVRGPDPVALLEGDPGPPWSVDVDPESLL